MSDTLGQIIDKLLTVDLKMWNNQELIYKIRKLTFEEFKEQFVSTDEKINMLWVSLQKACDLNMQRNQLINEIDLKIIEMIQLNDNLDNGKFLQRSHKTY